MIGRFAWRTLIRGSRGGGLIFGVFLLACPESVDAQESVRITLPAGITFAVTNIANTTTGSPNPAQLRFNQAILLPTKVLRVSVKADTPTFTPPVPSAKPIPASNVSWTTSNPTRVTGSNGTLSSSSYTLVFQSQANANNGNLDVTWSLSPPPVGVRAGAHQLTVRWKVESITP